MRKRRPTRKPSRTVTEPPLSPTLLELKQRTEKLSQKTIIQKAINDLTTLKLANGGSNKYGDISRIVNNYQSIGYSFVTRGTLCYVLEVEKKSLQQRSLQTKKTEIEVVEVSVLQRMDDDHDDSISELATRDGFSWVEPKPGRPKGVTRATKAAIYNRKQEAVTKAAGMFQDARRAARLRGRLVDNGCLNAILSKVEEEFGLEAGTIIRKTVISRVDRNNISAFAPQSVSPLSQVEPVLVDYCIRLAKMGSSLAKDQVIHLAESLIEGTPYRTELYNFKKERKIRCDEGDEDKCLVGSAWYLGFMKRNASEISRKKTRVKDVKRHTWCTYDRFNEMYQSVYEQMVSANVAIKHNGEKLYDKDGNVVEDPLLAVGLPTQYEVTNPSMILFVDETGKNTNMKVDGQIGGQLRVVPTDNSCTHGVLGSTTDMHFTVLCFTCATGDPVMCCVI